MNGYERQALENMQFALNVLRSLKVPEDQAEVQDKLDQTCDHLADRWVPVTLLDKSWNYCPKCGEKL